MDFGTHVQGSDSRVCHRIVGSLSDRTLTSSWRSTTYVCNLFVTPIRSFSTTRVTGTRRQRRWTSTLASKSPRRRLLLIFWEISQIKKKAGRNTVDGKTGASLKLTVLKDEGRVWTVVARRGESVLYAHTVVTHGWR